MLADKNAGQNMSSAWCTARGMSHTPGPASRASSAGQAHVRGRALQRDICQLDCCLRCVVLTKEKIQRPGDWLPGFYSDDITLMDMDILERPFNMLFFPYGCESDDQFPELHLSANLGKLSGPA